MWNSLLCLKAFCHFFSTEQCLSQEPGSYRFKMWSSRKIVPLFGKVEPNCEKLANMMVQSQTGIFSDAGITQCAGHTSLVSLSLDILQYFSTGPLQLIKQTPTTLYFCRIELRLSFGFCSLLQNPWIKSFLAFLTLSSVFFALTDDSNSIAVFSSSRYIRSVMVLQSYRKKSE